MKSGQILIIVLLIVVVTLAVGLSVASRNITNLRTSTQTERSQRAFSAAEGGVEDVLSRLSQVANLISVGTPTPGCSVTSTTTATCNVIVGDLQANVNVQAKKEYEATLTTGEVAQIDLRTYGGNVYIEWAKNNTDEANSPASLELTFVCSPGALNCIDVQNITSASGYKQRRYYYPGDSSRTDEQLTGAMPVCPSGSTEFKCKTATLSLGGTNVLFVRVKPFWKDTTVKVSGDSGFPVQIYEVNSLASTTEGITRKVVVQRTALPTLPAAFDYALFSEDPISK